MAEPPLRALPRFLAVGEALTDLIREGDDHWVSKAGGSTWNVARVVAKLGVASAFAGAISRDLFGDALWSASLAADLDPRFLQRLDKPPLLAIVHETAPPRYFFIGTDSADLHFDPGQLPARWQGAVEWAHFGGISLAREPLAGRLTALAAELKAAGARISYDPNYRSVTDAGYQAVLQRMTGLADLVKVSDEDLSGLFGGSNRDAAFAALRAWNPRVAYLYTRGADGASLHVGAESWTARPPRIEVIDAIGAGDASIGGLLFSLMTRRHRSWPAQLRFAVAAGTAACLAVGAEPPDLAAIERLYQATTLVPIPRRMPD